jgi:hypothetical protein
MIFFKPLNVLCIAVKCTQFVSVKTRLCLESRVYLHERATCFDPGYAILKLKTILKIHFEEDSIQIINICTLYSSKCVFRIVFGLRMMYPGSKHVARSGTLTVLSKHCRVSTDTNYEH